MQNQYNDAPFGRGPRIQIGPGDYEETTTRKVTQTPPSLPSPPPLVVTRHGVAIPEGINILGDSTTKRVGNTEKDKYLSHLHFLHGEGYLDDGEYEARKAYAEAAQTSAHLRMIVDDLPGFPAPSPKEQHQAAQADKYATLRQRLGENRAENAALILAMVVLGVSTVIVPWILVQKGQPITFAIAACGTLVGVAIVVGALTWASKAFNWG